MPLFRYTVEDKSGKTLNGVMQAFDEADLARRLTSMGYALRAVAPAGSVSTAAAPVAPSAGHPPLASPAVPVSSGTPVSAVDVQNIPPSLEPSISMRTLSSYLRQMATLIRSGMAPYDATTFILPRIRNRRLRRALQDMAAQVRSGGSLSPAMAAYPAVFPTKIVGLIYCGELGGFLDNALDEAATAVEEETKARLFTRLGYGVCRFFVVVAAYTYPAVRSDIWMKHLLNMTQGDKDAGLRYIQHFFLSGLLRISLPVIVAFFALTYIWPHVKRISSLRTFLDGVLIRTPLWGALTRSRSLARFGKSLAQLYAAGVSPGQAWVAASYSCPNTVLANKLHRVGRDLNRGQTFAETMAGSRVFDYDMQGLIIAGEQSGDLPGVLQKLSDFNQGRAKAQHYAGRWVSIGCMINIFVVLGGALTIVFFWGYGKILRDLLDQAFGG